ncbi:MAG: hypothetical protein ACLQNE_29835 [Thermoguttaceae bacterium]
MPNVTKNVLPKELFFDGTTWPPGVFALHPGIGGEYSVVRWTAPAAGRYALMATFSNIVVHGVATTDTHIFHQGKPIYEGFIDLHGFGSKAEFARTLSVAKGETIDVVVGIGNDKPFGNTTALAMILKSATGETYDVAADFSAKRNPNGAWTYGSLTPGLKPDLATFAKYPLGEGETRASIGRISNPGSSQWEDILSDQHPYQPLPHDAGVIRTLRTVRGGEFPVWLSEYGIPMSVYHKDDWAKNHPVFEGMPAGCILDHTFYREILKYADTVWANGEDCVVGIGPAPDYRESHTNAREFMVFQSLDQVWLPQNAIHYFDIIHVDDHFPIVKGLHGRQGNHVPDHRIHLDSSSFFIYRRVGFVPPWIGVSKIHGPTQPLLISF